MNARMRDYYLVLYRIVSSNWTMPQRLDARKKYEAVYVITIDRSGRILDGWFERKSGERLFDQFVELAVERSNLPPLPEVFTGDRIEVGLRFTPSGVNSR
jgi:colicin import membrane protein